MQNMEILFARALKYNAIKHFTAFGNVSYVFPPKKREKDAFLFENDLIKCYL